MIWTSETIKAATDLRNKGLSGAQIARELGNGATRNQVVSKMWRMGRSCIGAQTGGGDQGRGEHSDSKWDRETFAPYAEWKAERQMERQVRAK